LDKRIGGILGGEAAENSPNNKPRLSHLADAGILAAR